MIDTRTNLNKALTKKQLIHLGMSSEEASKFIRNMTPGNYRKRENVGEENYVIVISKNPNQTFDVTWNK